MGINRYNWQDETRSYRLGIMVSAAGYERYDKPVEIRLNFSDILSAAGVKSIFDVKPLKVVEVCGDTIINNSVPFQYDPDEGGSMPSSASGTLILLLEGITPANTARYFHLYFGTGVHKRCIVPPRPRIEVTDNIMYEGQDSYRITTENAIYYYHKQGAGFASMLDLDGNDWIGYHPRGGSDGRYRGIPNAGHPDEFFHPGEGNNSSYSTILNQGPLKVTILSEHRDKDMAATWEIFPKYARFTILRIGHPYWFLYEGTPGGRLDLENGYCVWSSGRRLPLSESWDQSLPSPEWIYFADGKTSRMLYFVHHESDDIIDSYWPMEGNMTVFGFGRKGLETHMKHLPAHFTIGFGDETEFSKAQRIIDSAFRDMEVILGKVEYTEDLT